MEIPQIIQKVSSHFEDRNDLFKFLFSKAHPDLSAPYTVQSTPSPTRSIFKWSTVGLNSEFSFF